MKITKKIDPIILERRKQKWMKSPRIPHGGQGYCAACRKKTMLRHIEPGPGDICFRCFVYLDRCKTLGCDDVAVENGLCRACFIGDDYHWDTSCFGDSAIAELQDYNF